MFYYMTSHGSNGMSAKTEFVAACFRERHGKFYIMRMQVRRILNIGKYTESTCNTFLRLSELFGALCVVTCDCPHKCGTPKKII